MRYNQPNNYNYNQINDSRLWCGVCLVVIFVEWIVFHSICLFFLSISLSYNIFLISIVAYSWCVRCEYAYTFFCFAAIDRLIFKTERRMKKETVKGSASHAEQFNLRDTPFTFFPSKCCISDDVFFPYYSFWVFLVKVRVILFCLTITTNFQGQIKTNK